MTKQKSHGKRARQAGRLRDAGSDAESRQDSKGAAEEVQSAHKHVPSPAAIRETIESVVVAFVLAFLVRTFEAEAFVIPTGSMAPTLMGRHKDLKCPVCGYQYRASASDEVDQNTNASLGPGAQIGGCTCPMCRYPLDLRSAVAVELADELTEQIADILVKEANVPSEVVAELAARIQTKPAEEIEDILAKELGLSFGAAARLTEKLAARIQEVVAAGVQEEYPSFKGDRILVGKFCYEFADPERWDVAVFKYPGGAKTNFIKRLVGLPGETIRIFHGDVFVRRDGDSFTIARKEHPEKLLAMLQPVYDNEYVLPEIIKAGWPARWQPWPSAKGLSRGAWATSQDYRSFRTDGRAAGQVWLRYQHFVPSPHQWQYLEKGKLAPDDPPRRQLISDFCAYNTSWAAKDQAPDRDSAGLHWVGDLVVQCTLEVFSGSGQAVFELVEGGWRMQCRLDVATGKARLAIEHEDSDRGAAETVGGQPYAPTAQTRVRGPGKYQISFANCDDQLRLWVNGSPVEFDGETAYRPLENTRPEETFLLPIGWEYQHELDGRVISAGLRRQFESQEIFLSDGAVVSTAEQGRQWLITDRTEQYHREYTVRKEGNALRVFDPADLAPAGIASEGADLRVSRLKILRDIYYIAEKYSRPQDNGALTDFEQIRSPHLLLCEPRLWDDFERMQWVDFRLEKDQFLALGDNSPKSKDSRLWEREGFEYYVKRELLIGKALYIYWPHSWNKLPGTNIPFPLFPNVARMGFVR